MTRSPGGSFVAYVQGLFSSFTAEVSRVWIVPLQGGEPIAVTDGRTRDWNPTWSADGRTLFYVSNRGGAMDLWRQRLQPDGKLEGDPEQISTGMGMRSAAFSPGMTKLAFSKGLRVSNVWRVPILTDRLATWADAEQITAEHANVQYMDVSPDGARLVVGSDRNGNQDLWILPSGGGAMAQLTTHPAPDDAPRWSPDGKEIAYRWYRSGNQEIWVIPADGGASRQLTDHPDEDSVPAWAPSGKEIVFSSRRKGGDRDVWAVPAGGGEPRFVIEGGFFPSYSPDGRWILFQQQQVGAGPLQQWRVPTAGGEPERLTLHTGQMGVWSRDGRTLYYSGWNERSGNLWALSLPDRREYQVTNFVGRHGTLGWGKATDGRYVYFTWWEDLGDIWVMDVVKSEVRQ